MYKPVNFHRMTISCYNLSIYYDIKLKLHDTYSYFVQWTKVEKNIYHIIKFWVGNPNSLYLDLISTSFLTHLEATEGGI